MARRRWRRPFLAACASLSLALAACGGGGDGLRVTIDPGQRLDASLILPGTIPVAYVYGSFAGELDQLWGRTLWFRIDDPEDVIAGIDPFIAGTRRGVTFTYWNPPAPGHHRGAMALRVSFDQAGKHQLAGSPLSIPYDVRVTSLLEVDTTPVLVSGTFAGPVQTRTIQLALNPETASWGVTLDLATEPGQPFSPQGCGFSVEGGLRNPEPPYGNVPAVACTADGAITLAFLPEPPGTYDGMLYLRASVPLDGQLLHVERQIPLSYQVGPSEEVAAFFYPAETHVTRTPGEFSSRGCRYRLLLNSGVTLDRARVEVEYLSHPSAADGGLGVDRWWMEDPYQGALTYDLPVGTYTARVRHPITAAGVESWLDHPVTLDIVPP